MIQKGIRDAMTKHFGKFGNFGPEIDENLCTDETCAVVASDSNVFVAREETVRKATVHYATVYEVIVHEAAVHEATVHEATVDVANYVPEGIAKAETLFPISKPELLHDFTKTTDDFQFYVSLMPIFSSDGLYFK